MTQQKSKHYSLLFPIIGIVVFILIYLTASQLYPGGSQADANSPGFNWKHNYWCNLLSDTAINGEPNPAKPLAITGLVELCITLLTFWFQYAKYGVIKICQRRLILISGTLSMLTGAFTFIEKYHNIIVNLAGLLGLITSLTILVTLYQNKYMRLFLFGLINVVLIGLNAFLFFNKTYIHFLPVVQKITFLTFLLWTCLISSSLYKTVSSK